MAHDGGGSPQDLVVESWIMYSIAMVFFFVRLISRYKRMGFQYQVEDYLMVVAVVFYTAFVVTNIKIAFLGSALYEPGQYESFSDQEINDRILGSKIEFGSEHCHLCTLYSLKSCMLLVYYRLTLNLKQHRFVKICAVYTLLGWLASELTLILNCHPVSGYWTLPPPQRECATYFRFEVIQFVFNVSSDIAILLVILPMILRTRMPWRTKLPVLVVFAMGIVVIICAIVSKYFTFRNIYDASYQFWYLREVSIGVWVTNAPFIWAMARSMISLLQSSSNPTYGRNHAPQYGTDRKSLARSKTGTGTDTRSTRVRTGHMYEIETIGESEENIIEMGCVAKGTHTSAASTGGSEPSDWGQTGRPDSGGEGEPQIWKTTEIIVEKS